MEHVDKLDAILHKLETLDEIKSDITLIKGAMNTVFSTINSHSSKIKSLEETIVELKNENFRLNKVTKEKNIVIIGLAELEKDINELENNVIQFIMQHLNINLISSDIEKVFRLGNNTAPKRPILISFASLKTRNSVLSKRSKLKCTNIFINEHLSVSELRNRKLKNSQKVKSSNHQEGDGNIHKRPRQTSEDTPTKLRNRQN